VQCADVSLASEPEPMCASGVTFWRWYVTKDGKPTGATFDTDLSGASFVPVGTAQPGICSTCSPFVASARSIQSTW
jgi:hypothetical protein